MPRITVRIEPPSDDRPNGYIGAQVSYPPRPGEDWERGNDLADGAFGPETLAAVLADVTAVVEGFRNAYERDRA